LQVTEVRKIFYPNKKSLIMPGLLEDGEREAGFGDGVPGPLHEVFELGRPQTSEENLPHQLAQQNHEDQRLHVDHGHAESLIKIKIFKFQVDFGVITQWSNDYSSNLFFL
jgi:hypothetical protein